MATSVYLLKAEPLSPIANLDETSPSSSPSWVPDNTIFDWTTLEDDYNNSIDDEQFNNDCESKAHVAAELLENLERLEDLDELIKEGIVLHI